MDLFGKGKTVEQLETELKAQEATNGLLEKKIDDLTYELQLARDENKRLKSQYISLKSQYELAKKDLSDSCCFSGQIGETQELNLTFFQLLKVGKTKKTGIFSLRSLGNTEISGDLFIEKGKIVNAMYKLGDQVCEGEEAIYQALFSFYSSHRVKHSYKFKSMGSIDTACLFKLAKPVEINDFSLLEFSRQYDELRRESE